MKYAILSLTVLSGIAFASIPAAGQVKDFTSIFSTDQEVHIDKTGKVQVTAAKVVQVSGTTVYAQSRFGGSVLRWLLPTNDLTRIKKRFGGPIAVSDIKNGDYVNFAGIINTTSDSLYILTSEIVDWTRSDEVSTFSGTVSGFSTSTPGFILTVKGGDSVTVLINSSTVISKGKRSIQLSDIKQGERIIEASGILDMLSKTMRASSVIVYQDTGLFVPRNFQGVLKSIDSTANPLQLTVTIEGRDYGVQLKQGGKILNTKREAVLPARFMVGDTIRLYGSIRETDLTAIDAEIIRNISL